MPDFDLDAALVSSSTNSLSKCQLYGSDWPDGFAYLYADVGKSFLFIGKLNGDSAQTPYSGNGVQHFDTKEAALKHLLHWASEAFDNGWTNHLHHHRVLLPSDSYRFY